MKTFLIKTWDIESCNMNVYTQKTFTCLKSTEAAQEKGVKYVQSQQKKTPERRNIDVVLVVLLLILNIFHTFF